MTCIRFMEFLLFLHLRQVWSEQPEPMFRRKGSLVELGYCFGVDYIVVYRSASEGDQLLGNSSNKNMANTPPADLQGRTHISENMSLLGLKISNLTHLDSGIYRRECWQNQTRVSQNKQQLLVCNEEIESEEIVVNEEGGGTKLLCNSNYIGLKGTSVRWYYEIHPSYKLTLLLDSSVSLEPQLKELSDVVEVKDSGAALVVDNSLLMNNQHFYCLVIKDLICLTFQNMYPPDHSESREVFASQGDRVVLNCPADDNNQKWETPLGIINSSSMRSNQMYISAESEDFSLVIPVVSDEHSGDYSCISPLLTIQYLLIVCPQKESQHTVVHEGGDLSLECSFGQDNSQGVQWHRQLQSGEYELLCDTDDKTVPIPEDLTGRLTLSENGSLLTISDLELKDAGVYLCVIVQSPGLLEDDGDYEEDYDKKAPGEDGLSNDHDWHDMLRCIFKQETILTILTRRAVPVTFPSVIQATVDQSDAPNVTAYAVGAGLVGLLIIGVIIAVIAIRRRASTSQTQRGAASRSGGQTKMDIQMGMDPGCTEKLTSNDDVA